MKRLATTARARRPFDPSEIPVPGDLARELLDLLSSPNIGSRSWVWRQYDHVVRGGTVVRPGSDAGVVRVPCKRGSHEVEKFLAFAVDCSPRICELDPFVGGAIAIAEVCRNLVCTGAEPIGITDCLNFGNPERPEVMDSLSKAIDGIRAACVALDVPIVSGNVSLYNETSVRTADGEGAVSRAILPTPTVAAVGLIAASEHIVPTAFRREKDAIVLFGQSASLGARGLGASEWLVRKMGKLSGEAPGIDLEAEAQLQKLILTLARARLLESAHDVSDGGLAVALAECCTVAEGHVGARVELVGQSSAVHATAALFGEAPSRIVASLSSHSVDHVLERARRAGVPASVIGQTGGSALSITIAPLGSFAVPTSVLSASREACLKSIVGD